MARWGNCDYRQLQRLQQKLNKLQSGDIETFCRQCAKELAARLLAKVIERTPVGQYDEGSGKAGGTLKRGWTMHNDRVSEYKNSGVPSVFPTHQEIVLERFEGWA